METQLETVLIIPTKVEQKKKIKRKILITVATDKLDGEDVSKEEERRIKVDGSLGG